MHKIVMVFGTFDILHPGHIFFLTQAKKLGDYLIAVLARNENIRRLKGHLPNHTERDRKEMLDAVKLVDKVVFGSKKNYLAAIIKFRPQIIALGYDQKYFTDDLQKKLLQKGLRPKIVRIRSYKPRKYHTRKLINPHET